jgi:hypothetical protein
MPPALACGAGGKEAQSRKKAYARGPRHLDVRALAGRQGHGVARKERREVSGDGDGPHTGPSASVGNAEGLVQVQVAHVRTDVARRGQAHLQRSQQRPTIK